MESRLEKRGFAEDEYPTLDYWPCEVPFEYKYIIFLTSFHPLSCLVILYRVVELWVFRTEYRDWSSTRNN